MYLKFQFLFEDYDEHNMSYIDDIKKTLIYVSNAVNSAFKDEKSIKNVRIYLHPDYNDNFKGNGNSYEAYIMCDLLLLFKAESLHVKRSQSLFSIIRTVIEKICRLNNLDFNAFDTKLDEVNQAIGKGKEFKSAEREILLKKIKMIKKKMDKLVTNDPELEKIYKETLEKLVD